MSRERLLPDDKTLEKVSRYEAHLSRQLYKDSCGGFLSGTILEVLREIAALPDHTRNHPRESAHPQMRLFPNGAVYCLVCWS
jgi:hypothetical protein